MAPKFVTDAGLSRQTALSLAQLSELVYEAPAVVRAFIESIGMQSCWLEASSSDSQGVIAFDDDRIIIAFRGTKEPADWLTDLCFKQQGMASDGDGRRVHRGFMSAQIEIGRIVRAVILDSDRRGGLPVFVTGHSLGGALAVLEAHELAENGFEVHLCTFGQPRVGSSELMQEVWEKTKSYWRLVNNNDVVPRSPPSDWNFAHAGLLHHISHDGQVMANPSWWVMMADRIIGRIKSRQLNPLKWTTDGLDDHSMAEYVRLVRAWAESE